MKALHKNLLLFAILVACALSFGANKYYGVNRNRAGDPAVRAFSTVTGVGTITDTGGRCWTPTMPARFAIVQLAQDATANMVCRVNETTANKSGGEWDFELEPGQAWSGFGDVQLGIQSIACKADGDPGTEGETFVVKFCD